MAKYMITWELPPEVRNEAISRFMDGTSMQPPDGVSVLGRWFLATGGGHVQGIAMGSFTVNLDAIIAVFLGFDHHVVKR